jgi:hypothetical protein
MSDKVEKPILELKLADLPLSASATQKQSMEPETVEEVAEGDDA